MNYTLLKNFVFKTQKTMDSAERTTGWCWAAHSTRLLDSLTGTGLGWGCVSPHPCIVKNPLDGVPLGEPQGPGLLIRAAIMSGGTGTGTAKAGNVVWFFINHYI